MGEHTLPDYTTKYKMATVFGGVDDAELASRLGSIVNYDRRGKVVFMDSFEETYLKWTEYKDGAGADAYLTNRESIFGDQSLKTISGDTAEDYCGVQRRFPLPPTTKVGVQCNIMMVNEDMEYYIYMDLYTGVKRYYSGVLFDDVNNTLKIYITGGVWQPIATELEVQRAHHNWHYVKYVIDRATNKYVRLIFNGVEYDISAYSMRDRDEDEAPNVHIRLQNIVKQNNNIAAYWDGFVLTHDEP